MISTPLQNTLESYVNSLLDKSPVTIQAYAKDVKEFLVYASQRKVKTASKLNRDVIINYLGKKKTEGSSNSSVNRYFMSIRSYCKFLQINDVLYKDICSGIAAPRNKRKAPQIPSISQVEALLNQPDLSTPAGVRDKAILELLYSSGLRASELCDLLLSDVNKGSVMVRCGKREQTRTIPVTSTAQEAIDNYLNMFRLPMQQSLWRPCNYLFLTLAGKPLSRHTTNDIVCRHAKTAGLKGVTTHTLRHACATHLLDAGADIRLIQEILGHTNITSTRWYTHLSSINMQKKFQFFHPRKGTTYSQVSV